MVNKHHKKVSHQLQLIQNRKYLLHTKWLHCTLFIYRTFSCLTMVIIDFVGYIEIWEFRGKWRVVLFPDLEATDLSSSQLSSTCGFSIFQDNNFSLSQQPVLLKQLRVTELFWVGLGKRQSWGKWYNTQVTQLVGTKFWMTCSKVHYKIREETGFCLPTLTSEVFKAEMAGLSLQ